MKVFMTGGSGFVGGALLRRFVREGHEVTLLTRKAGKEGPLPGGAVYLEGNPLETGEWQRVASGHDVIVNLAGASIFQRWTKAAKQTILESRIITTRHLVEALSMRRGREALFLSTSAVGYYGFHEDEEIDEGAPPGDGFLASVAREWEEAAMEAEACGARVVILRFGVVLGKGGGALGQLLPLFSLYLGSPLGSGRQWFSWIHEEDLARIYLHVMKRGHASGPYNCTSPNPVRNREFTEVLGDVLGKPTFLPAVPAFALRWIAGEFSSTLLKGQRVIPRRLRGEGFSFTFPDLRGALEGLTPRRDPIP